MSIPPEQCFAPSRTKAGSSVTRKWRLGRLVAVRVEGLGFRVAGIKRFKLQGQRFEP